MGKTQQDTKTNETERKKEHSHLRYLVYGMWKVAPSTPRVRFPAFSAECVRTPSLGADTAPAKSAKIKPTGRSGKVVVAILIAMVGRAIQK